jgi:hypothetical protein
VWRDAQADLQYGVAGRREDDFHAVFWLNEHGGQHPDAYRGIDVEMTRGKRFETPQPRLIIFGGPADVPPGALLRELRCAQSGD